MFRSYLKRPVKALEHLFGLKL